MFCSSNSSINFDEHVIVAFEWLISLSYFSLFQALTHLAGEPWITVAAAWTRHPWTVAILIPTTIFQLFCPCNLHPEPFTFGILRVIQTRASEGLFVVVHSTRRFSNHACYEQSTVVHFRALNCRILRTLNGPIFENTSRSHFTKT